MGADLITAPTPTHIIYIPFCILIGLVIGYVVGRKAGIKEGASSFMGAGPDEDDDL